MLVVAGLGLAAAIMATGGDRTRDGAVPSPLAPGRSLTVATVEGALPLSGTRPDGRLGGFHVAVARAVCARLGAECRFAMMAPAELMRALKTGAVDMVAADVVAWPDETAGVVLAPPHARRSSLVVARAALVDEAAPAGDDAPPAGAEPANLAVLSGRVVAAVAGSDQAAALRGLAPAEASVVLAERQAEVLRALREGDADVAVLPLSVAVAFLMRGEGAGFRVLGGPVRAARAGGPVSLAVDPGDAALARAVGRAVIDLRREGRLMAMARDMLPLPEAAAPLATVARPRAARP
ncbi:transporter substrate-binding domain-containing protein [Roseospira visakhapatnamensis]|uniref:ABC-type amino acid transport substrate-binding protein n=1 Tax=Roseospira visakhapatnamensis TaxID=390880 RepID=A0A7W6WAD1_9PROT|nr:ABC-type amino acid transport substrate-binding protein [Roseospira visakhapatnamensis]